MTILGISASNGELYCQDHPERPVRPALDEALAALPTGVPVAVMIHGYRFDPAIPRCDPHRLIYALHPDRVGRRVVSWPGGLGFTDDPETGLCIGFGWPAFGAKTGRSTRRFAAVYRRAAVNSAALARLLSLVGGLAPHRTVDIVAHSLGARVALGALPLARNAVPGRMILMGGAEFCASAARAMAGCAARRRPEVYNFISRQNALFDLIFSTLAPKPCGRRRALGKGLVPAPDGWIDIRTESPALAEFAARRGVSLGGWGSPVSHWGFYTRPGAMAVYRGLLRDRGNWSAGALGKALEPARATPRFRLVPARRRPKRQLSGA